MFFFLPVTATCACVCVCVCVCTKIGAVFIQTQLITRYSLENLYQLPSIEEIPQSLYVQKVGGF